MVADKMVRTKLCG